MCSLTGQRIKKYVATHCVQWNIKSCCVVDPVFIMALKWNLKRFRYLVINIYTFRSKDLQMSLKLYKNNECFWLDISWINNTETEQFWFNTIYDLLCTI